ncbi:helix-turn-helix domain-containing protein [Xylophilus sp.]|uniref:helix-turn-helix domain-containing protein n=1 Tax=Xylophilus sp. TaxID=2653893 RepID=UPI002D7E81A9|nr:helix-turn-helix transcriptional regulator [Xylophilus sp.]
MKAFAAELKAQRGARGISQEEFAFRCRVNRTFIAKIELAQNQPSLTVLLKIAEGLETDLPALLAAAMRRYRKEVDASAERSAAAEDGP